MDDDDNDNDIDDDDNDDNDDLNCIRIFNFKCDLYTVSGCHAPELLINFKASKTVDWVLK